MAKIIVIQGPNLNLLGEREPALYGKMTLQTLHKTMTERAKGHELLFFQSNAEHEIIDKLHHCKKDHIAFIIINPAAFTHTSIALRDAFIAIHIPFIEVHLSNIYARETFRHHSYLSDIAQGTVSGLGPYGYYAALEAAIAQLS